MFELVLSLSYTIIFIIMINVLDIYKKKHSTKDVDLIKIARSKINIVNQYMRVPDFKSLTFPFKDPEENIKITQMRDKIVKKIKEEKTLEASSSNNLCFCCHRHLFLKKSVTLKIYLKTVNFCQKFSKFV